MTSLARLQHQFAAAVRGKQDDAGDCGIAGARLAPAQRLGIDPATITASASARR